jgi:serine/threonine protein kinase
LHEKIGQGGFGTVHKVFFVLRFPASQPSSFDQATWIHAQGSNEMVAVKIVPFHPDDEELESELSIMNKVKDGRAENLVHIKALYFFEKRSSFITSGKSSHQTHMGIVMNWYEDGSLRALLTRTQHHKKASVSLSWNDKLQLCLDVCNGLDKLHQMHLLHRDVKADNVLLKNSDGRMRGKLFFVDLSQVLLRACFEVYLFQATSVTLAFLHQERV